MARTSSSARACRAGSLPCPAVAPVPCSLFMVLRSRTWFSCAAGRAAGVVPLHGGLPHHGQRARSRGAPRAPPRPTVRAVTQFSGYLTEEVVEDYADGIISRREALHRLGMLGVGTALAGPLLTASEAGQGNAGGDVSNPPGSSPAGPAPLPTEAVTFDGPG